MVVGVVAWGVVNGGCGEGEGVVFGADVEYDEVENAVFTGEVEGEFLRCGPAFCDKCDDGDFAVGLNFDGGGGDFVE